jgi:hypothetical protein
VPPARERFRADELAGGHVHLGLEEGLELPRAKAGDHLRHRNRGGGHALTAGGHDAVARDQVAELLGRGGLFDGAEEIHPVGGGHGFDGRDQVAVEGARQDHRHLRARLAHVADELHAVHLGHVEIAHDDVHRAAGLEENVERGPSVGGLEHLERAEGGQHPNEGAALELVVLGDQEPQLRDLHLPASRSLLQVRGEASKLALQSRRLRQHRREVFRPSRVLDGRAHCPEILGAYHAAGALDAVGGPHDRGQVALDQGLGERRGISVVGRLELAEDLALDRLVAPAQLGKDRADDRRRVGGDAGRGSPRGRRHGAPAAAPDAAPAAGTGSQRSMTRARAVISTGLAR